MAKTGSNTYTQTYTDDLGNPVVLGKELARGGEGRVCLVQGNSNVVAKLYLDKALNKHDKAGKIEAMCNLYDKDIAKFSALPQRVIFDAHGKVVGFIMEKITDFKEIHNLYGISTKRKLFDFADWGFMVHSAKNLAIAVNKLHSKNIVIGDINQGNILVNNQAMIKLIDCDSYQVEYNGKFYLCEVGVPEYTSPELQGQSFNGIQRTKNHDCFGLAVMIFKILMFGRHPYSGVGAPPEIENAIKQGCYCYGNYSKGTTPIYSQLFSEVLSDEVKELFDRAFSKNKNIIRPTAEEWINTLECLEQNLIQCSNNHKYYNNGNSCIWCKLSKFGFNPFSNSTVNNKPQNTPNYQQTPYTYNPPKQQSTPNTNYNNSYQPSQSKQTQPVANKINLKPVFIILAVIFFAGMLGAFNDSNDDSTYTPPVTNQETNNNTTQEKSKPKESEQEIQNYKQSDKTDEKIINNSVSQNKFKTPYEYTMFVKEMLQNSYSSKYSVDCSILVTPQENVTILDNGLNADIAYNFLQSQLFKIPKYIDDNGKTVPIVIGFSGHEIYRVGYQQPPQTTKSNTYSDYGEFSSFANDKTPQKTKNIVRQSVNSKPNLNTVQTSKPITNMPVNKPKTDLQQSSDWFFE